MTGPKFDESDRATVIADVERNFGVRLTRLGSRRKVLLSDAGHIFWIFGGYEDWHGISAPMFDRELPAGASETGKLIVAKRTKSTIAVYEGPLKPLIEGRAHLSRTRDGDYQFNIRIRGSHLFIKEVPSLILTRIGTLDSDSSPSLERPGSGNAKKIERIREMLASLSIEERMALLDQIENDET